jgi:hypothetical protein
MTNFLLAKSRKINRGNVAIVQDVVLFYVPENRRRYKE